MKAPRIFITCEQRVSNLEKNSFLRNEYDRRSTQQSASLLRLKLEEIESELSSYHCPISQTIPVEPVIAEDEHTYDKAELIKWIDKGGTSPLVPSMRLDKEHLVRNRFVEERIIKLREEKKKLEEMIETGEEEKGIGKRQMSCGGKSSDDEHETEAYDTANISQSIK